MFSFRNVANKSRLASVFSVLALSLALAACGDGGSGDGSTLDLGGDVRLDGAGASFPKFIYERWFQDINGKYPNLRVNYESIGSGAGVKQFTAGTVDFGASDVAMKDEEIAKVDRGVLLLPMTGGSVVLAYYLPDVKDLKLPREVSWVRLLIGTPLQLQRLTLMLIFPTKKLQL